MNWSGIAYVIILAIRKNSAKYGKPQKLAFCRLRYSSLLTHVNFDL